MIAVGVMLCGETQQWMCEAVVVPTRPLKLMVTDIMCVVVSQLTEAVPVPGEALGGNSLGPLRTALNVSVSALARLTPNTSAAAIDAATIVVALQFISPPLVLRYSSTHALSRMIGTSAPSEPTPLTSTSGPPIMKSVWTTEWLTPRALRPSPSSSSAPSTQCARPAPYAM